MMTTPTAIRFVRMSLAVSLLGGALQIGSAHLAAAAEWSAAPTAETGPEAQDAGQTGAASTSTPAVRSRFTTPMTGAVGFGWG